MSQEREAEIGYEKASVYHAIGVLLGMVLNNSEVVFESDFELKPHSCQTEKEVDIEDQLMSVVALLCEPFKGRPDLIEECKDYCFLEVGITIEAITFDNEQKPYLTLVSDRKVD